MASAAPASQPSNLEFLEGDAGRAAIVDDSADPYFARMVDHEMAAKTGSPVTGDTPAAKITECKKRYQNAVTDFTDEEKQALTFFISKINPAMKRDFPVFGNIKWSLIKTEDSLEGGMAWTRGPHVILPSGMLQRFVTARAGMGDASIMIAAALLVHEQTHVLERLHPDLFVPLYTKTLHFVHAGTILTDKWTTDRQLINPDGTVYDWVFPIKEDGKQTYLLPILMFTDPTATDLGPSIGTVAMYMEKSGKDFKPIMDSSGVPMNKPLGEVQAYMEGPGAEENNYHPNEIAADRFAELFLFDDLMDAPTKAKIAANGTTDKLEDRLKPIRDWAKPAFANPHK